MAPPKKDPFGDLDEEYKTGVQSMSDMEIKARVAEINLELQALLNAKEKDEDLQAKAIAHKEAGKVYRDGQKGAKLRTRYALYILEARGKA